MPPLIGITSYPPNPADRYELPRPYVDSVRRAGGIPVLLAPGDPHAGALLARLDGVVLAGGGDVDPGRWGGPDHPAIEYVDHARDELELELAREAADEGVPTLAICRGLQVLNVALGGTLHAHLPDVVDGVVPHKREPQWAHRHPVEAEPGSLVADAMGTERAEPASWHHQAVDRPGAGLTVTAWADDGVIEALELVGHPWLIAVQWHPEMTSHEDPTQQKLFDELVIATGGSRP